MSDAPARAGLDLDRLTGIARNVAPGGHWGLIALLLALVATAGTLRSMMFQVPELGLLALAMVIPLISGGLNLAIIATTNQCALLMAWILTTLITPESGGAEVAGVIALALLAGFLLSLAIGLVTGFLVANMGVHPILVTLGTMSVVNGVSIWLTRGTVISGFPPEILWIGNGTVAGIPVSFLLFLLAAVAVGLFLTRTPLGIGVYMVGSNPEATRYSGVDVKRVLIGVYTLSSVLCFVAAIIIMARFNSASAGYAQSYLLVTILAAVLGGVDPFGGFGRIGGLVLALLILQVISSGFNLLGLSQHLTLAIWGLTLIGVMAVKTLAGAWSSRRAARALPS
jgi:simple sugar transport system permease protein